MDDKKADQIIALLSELRKDLERLRVEITRQHRAASRERKLR